MSIVLPLPSGIDPVESLPPFLRQDWSLQHPQLASCAKHDHLALIYENQSEQLDIVIPFLRLGLERGEKAVYVHDDNTAEAVTAAMERHGIDVAGATDCGALVIVTKQDAYLRNGNFDPDWMVCFLAELVECAKAEGFSAVRASGEMTWALGRAENPHGRLIDYECKLNSFFPGHDVAGICQYNRRRFRPETLMRVIQTHPRLVFQGDVCENPYYVAPEFSPGQKTAADDPVRFLLESMAENTQLRRRLRAEMEARSSYEELAAGELAAAGRIASSIAREITDPLEAMTNHWYMLSHAKLSREAGAYVECMGRELERVSHIARETFEFYRSAPSAGPVDLASILDEAERELAEEAQWQGAVIGVDLRAQSMVCGNARELRELFVHLIANALEAGARRIHIRASHGCDGRDRSRRGLRITVADDGHGIEPGYAGRLFEPFLTSKEEKGAGMGLWRCKGIVQKHEGSIAMRTSTRAGRCGTSFSIFLPLFQPAD